jgi:hypothetical protein
VALVARDVPRGLDDEVALRERDRAARVPFRDRHRPVDPEPAREEAAGDDRQDADVHRQEADVAEPVGTAAPGVHDDVHDEEEDAGVEPGGAVDEVLHRPRSVRRLELGGDDHHDHQEDHEDDAELDRQQEVEEAPGRGSDDGGGTQR